MFLKWNTSVSHLLPPSFVFWSDLRGQQKMKQKTLKTFLSPDEKSFEAHSQKSVWILSFNFVTASTIYVGAEISLVSIFRRCYVNLFRQKNR